MSDKKDNSQLLPFHKPSERSLADNEGAADSLDEQDDLQQLIHRLRLPEPTEQLDHRILSSYTEQIERQPFWKRLFKGTIPIPIPIAAIIVLSIASLIYLALRSSVVVVKEIPKPAPSDQVRVVEVPVVQERVHIVYVDKQSRKHPVHSHDGQVYAGIPDFDGFKPVDELKIRLIKDGDQHEK